MAVSAQKLNLRRSLCMLQSRYYYIAQLKVSEGKAGEGCHTILEPCP